MEKVLTLSFVERDQDDGTVVVKPLIVQKGDQPIFKPTAHEIDTCIMTLTRTSMSFGIFPNGRLRTYIIDQVGCDETPLRNRTVVEIIGEVIDYMINVQSVSCTAYQHWGTILTVPNPERTFSHIRNGIVDHQRVVLADIVCVAAGTG